MRRKPFLASGIILSIIYDLAVVFSACLLIAAVIFYFAGDAVQIVNDIFMPFLTVFLAQGNLMMLIYVLLVFVGSIFFLVLSTRFIKYSGLDNQKIQNKKGRSIFFLILFILVTGGLAYLLMNNLSVPFETMLVFNCIICLLILLHVISIVLIIVGLSKIKNIAYPAPQAEAQIVQAENQKPLIYTAGLDEHVKTEQPKEEVKTEQPKPVLEESQTTKSLIEGISKLDQMRKEGSISAQEYTKLRIEMIRKFTK